VEFLTFIGAIVILAFVISLHSRVQKLEKLIKGEATQRAPKPSDQPQSQQLPVPQPTTFDSLLSTIKQQLERGVRKEEVQRSLTASGWQGSDIEKAFHFLDSSAQVSQHAVVPKRTGPTPVEAFIEWLKEDWLIKLGALLLLIGFGWFTTYAFLHNWIGPMGRIALGIVAGTLFLLLGWWRMKTHIHQGGIFLVLGSTTILLTVFAAREIYDFFTPLSALIVMFLSTAFVAFMSVTYKNRSLAVASLVLAGIAPLLTNAPTVNYVGLFAYLLVVVFGAIWIVVLTGRRELTAVALTLVTLYSLPHLLSLTSTDREALLLFAYAFAAILFVTNTAGILRLKGKEIVPDLLTAAGNGLFLLAWIMTAAQDEWKSLIISAWMLVFAVGAFLVFRSTQRREPFYAYAGVGIAMLAAATSAELKGATLTIAYTIESGVIALIAYAVLQDSKVAERISLLLAVPALLSVESMNSRAWALSVIHKDFFVLLVLGLTFLGLGLFFWRRVREVGDKEAQLLNILLLVVGSAYVYTLLWLSLHAALRNDDVAVMVSLIVYTVVGLITYFYRPADGSKGLRLYGGALLGFVVGRLLLVDVWRMELTGRIMTFFLIGALLVSTAFLGEKKHRSRLPDTPQ